MRRAARGIAALLAAALLAGCASAGGPGVGGRMVTVVMEAKGAKVKGELLVVDKERLWVRAKDGVREIPLSDVRAVNVQRHGLDARKTLAWVATGAVVSGVGMAAACNSVEDPDGCGGVGAVMAGLWLLIGTPAALSLDSSSRIEYAQPTVDTLRPYARLPQGLPNGLAPATLGQAPGGPAPAKP